MSDPTGKTILAVDLGTSGPKVGLVACDGSILASVFEPVDLVLLPGGGAEQDPQDWWRAITGACRALVADAVVDVASIAGVCCTSQWSGTVAVDDRGRHLANAVIWMDTRGARYQPEVAGSFPRVAGYGLFRLLRWLRLTGGAPTPTGKDPVGHILWLRHERPEVYGQTSMFLEPKDYLNLRLTGCPAASFDSIALHWVTDNRDIDKVHYDRRLLSAIGLPREKLPDLKPATEVLGPLCREAASDLGVPAGIPVIMGTPDVQSAALGSGAVLDYDAHLYVGTSSWITCHVPFKKTDVAHNMASLPSAVPGRYFVANEQECAGGCLNLLLDNILYCDDELRTGNRPEDALARLDRVAATAPAGSRDVIFTPWLVGERTPVEDHNLRGGFFNLSLGTTRADLVRSVLEGVAYNSRWLLGHVERFVGRRLDPIRMIGGGARSRLWCQVLADVLDRTIQPVADPIQANLRGAGLLGAVGLGLLRWEDIPGCVDLRTGVQPQASNRAVYDRLFGAFMQIHKRNRKLYAALNRGRESR